jgi:hypothetical protein
VKSVTLDSVNFTACFAAIQGSALDVPDSLAECTAVHLTLVGLTGESGIDSFSSTVISVSYSNFYDNNVGSVLFLGQSGISVESCIFSGNDEDVGIHSNANANAQFTFANCVFSVSFPSFSNRMSFVTNNIERSATASWAIAHLDTFLCHANGQAPTLLSFDCFDSVIPAVWISGSRAWAKSISFPPSQPLGESKGFERKIPARLNLTLRSVQLRVVGSYSEAA